MIANFPLLSINSFSPSLTCSRSFIKLCFDHLKIISFKLSSSAYKNFKPLLKLFSLDKEKPKFGISSLVSLKVTFGLYFLQISATSFTVTVFS